MPDPTAPTGTGTGAATASPGRTVSVAHLVDFHDLLDLPPDTAVLDLDHGTVALPAAAITRALGELRRLVDAETTCHHVTEALGELHRRHPHRSICAHDQQPWPCLTSLELHAAQGLAPETPTPGCARTVWRTFTVDERARSDLARRWAHRYTPLSWREIVAHHRGHRAYGDYGLPQPTPDLTDQQARTVARTILYAIQRADPSSR